MAIGWSKYPVQRPDLNGIGFLFWKNEATTSNCSFKNNIILNSVLHHVYILQGATFFRVDFQIAIYIIRIDLDSFNYFGSLHNFTSLENYYNKDLNSILSDPKFVSIATLQFPIFSPLLPVLMQEQPWDYPLILMETQILSDPDIGALEFVNISPKPPTGLKILK